MKILELNDQKCNTVNGNLAALARYQVDLSTVSSIDLPFSYLYALFFSPYFSPE